MYDDEQDLNMRVDILMNGKEGDFSEKKKKRKNVKSCQESDFGGPNESSNQFSSSSKRGRSKKTSN